MNLSLYAAAERYGVTYTTLLAVEGGHARIQTAQRVANCYGRRLSIHAPRSRKESTSDLAKRVDLAVNTVKSVLGYLNGNNVSEDPLVSSVEAVVFATEDGRIELRR